MRSHVARRRSERRPFMNGSGKWSRRSTSTQDRATRNQVCLVAAYPPAFSFSSASHRA
jgi:hypothetical protein